MVPEFDRREQRAFDRENTFTKSFQMPCTVPEFDRREQRSFDRENTFTKSFQMPYTVPEFDRCGQRSCEGGQHNWLETMYGQSTVATCFTVDKINAYACSLVASVQLLNTVTY